MEIKKGTLVRCKLSHQFFRVEEYVPARECRYYGAVGAKVLVKATPKERAIYRDVDKVVVLA